VQLNGGTPVITTYNAANQITNAGFTYDFVGNLTNDGTASTYDALNLTTARGDTTYASNGDGTLQPPPGTNPQQPQHDEAIFSFPGVGPGTCATSAGFDLSPGAEAFRLPFPLNPPQGPVVFTSIYMGADGQPRQSFDPANAVKPAKFGYAAFIGKNYPLGSSYFDDKWFDEGLVAIETYNGTWQDPVLEAMENTQTINFLVDGMDFSNPSWIADAKQPDGRGWLTHWEMDQVILKNYISRLHLWENGEEIKGFARAQWLDAWKQLRGLP